jgi:hypothetical protein
VKLAMRGGQLPKQQQALAGVSIDFDIDGEGLKRPGLCARKLDSTLLNGG